MGEQEIITENQHRGCYNIINTSRGSYVLDKNDFIGRHIFQHYIWEPELVLFYESIIDLEYTVLDIGAHMGYHTINFSRLAGRVYAFEPQIRLYNQLCGNVFLNDYNNKTFCFNVGLGEVEKKSAFGSIWKHQAKNWIGDWDENLINFGGRSLEDDVEIKDVTIKTLDSFNLQPTLIKIDVEGYEHNVLLGAKKTLRENKPLILIEVFNHNKGSVFSFLYNFGYEIFDLPNKKGEFNYLAIHPAFINYFKIKKILIKE